MILLTEHEAFRRIADGLKMAEDGAKMMAMHRPDQGQQWMKMAQVYQISQQAVYQLSAEAASKTKDIQ